MKWTMWIGGGLVALIAVLAGATYVGAQLAGSNDAEASTGQTSIASDDEPSIGQTSIASDDEAKDAEEAPKRPGAPARVMELMTDDGSGPVSVRITVEPSPDLPDRPTDAAGVFVSRDDNTMIVGTGGTELDVDIRMTAEGAIEPQVTLSHTGPEIEVVVTHDTIIYREETEMPSPGKGGEQTVLQVVRPVDSLDELGQNTEVQVWGRKSGDRVVAEVLVYKIVTVDLPF